MAAAGCLVNFLHWHAADEEEQQEAEPEPAAKPAAKKRKSQAKVGGAADAEGSSGPLGLPMQLNKTLTGARGMYCVTAP